MTTIYFIRGRDDEDINPNLILKSDEMGEIEPEGIYITKSASRKIIAFYPMHTIKSVENT